MEFSELPVPPGTRCQALNENLNQCPNLATYADDYYGDKELYNGLVRKQPECVIVYLCEDHR